MASYHDLLDAIARVRASSGDPAAWEQGLTGQDIAIACNPASPPAAIGAVLAKVTAAHPAVFLSGGSAQPDEPGPRTGEGRTAEAILDAESALGRLNSEAARVDLQVVTALFNAHATHEAGLADLLELQRAIEASVQTRTDLDTPAGAREFQRFLIGKLREIRDIVDNAGLDDSSKQALAAALASLYAASTPAAAEEQPLDGRTQQADHRPDDPGPNHAAGADRDEPADTLPQISDAADRPEFGELRPQSGGAGPTLVEVPSGWPAVDAATAPAQAPPVVAAQPAPAAPAWPSPPGGMATGGFPEFGNAPPAGLPGSAALNGGLGRAIGDTAELPLEAGERIGRADPEASDDHDDPIEEPPADDAGDAVVPPAGDGLAHDPELAAAIAAAVGGTPIAEAFRMQNIVIPAPGSAIDAPIDATQLLPGDIGLLADRHALVLGSDRVLLDDQIQPVVNVTRPGFIGWLHPPAASPTTPLPEAPASNRAAATAPS